ncbi:MAG: ATP-binding cassette domain-containing protein, partial [Desulfobacula sp.]|nr:ATP-binding cassette domain-containing protein [Desulfobacula sp.]
MLTDRPLLRVEHLKKYFPLSKGGLFREKGKHVRAVDDVSFSINYGETLGLVGESGSGKTTVGRCILRLIEPNEGTVFLDDTQITSVSRAMMKNVRRNMQIIFQDPYGSLTPRMRLYSLLREPLDVHGIGAKSERKQKVTE